MYPLIKINYIPVYYLMMLSGIIAGYFAFILNEEEFFTEKGFFKKLRTVIKLSICYLIIAALCIQGANYFHYFFDNIPPQIKDSLTIQKILFTHPFKTTKVLYGAVFFYPVGIYISSLILKKKFADLLNQKTFILFIVLFFARLGCFLNGCCFGIVSKTFGLSFPTSSAASYEHWKRGLTQGFVPPPSLPVIPTQLISAFFLFLMAVFAYIHFSKKKKHTFVKFVFLYALFRFSIEFIRDDFDRAYWWFFSTSQWISVFIFIITAIFFLIKKYESEKV
jgi:phosphatidylglycerol:prolipoprotein diacylglycerol transferase